MTHSYYNKLIAVDTEGKPFAIDQDPNPTGPVGWVEEPLAPGAQHEIKGLPIVLGDVDRGAAETVIRASADDSVHLRFRIAESGREKRASAADGRSDVFHQINSAGRDDRRARQFSVKSTTHCRTPASCARKLFFVPAATTIDPARSVRRWLTGPRAFRCDVREQFDAGLTNAGLRP